MAKTKLSVNEIIQQHPIAWAALSTQQEIFLKTFLAGGISNKPYDLAAAVRTAYPRVKASQAWGSRLLQNKHVKKIIILHMGLTPAEVTLGDINALIKRSRRKGQHLDMLVPYWIRAVAALESIVAKDARDARLDAAAAKGNL